MPTPTELLHANLHEVFNERDPERRRAVIETTHAPDVTFQDPEGIHTGWDDLEAAALALLSRAPAEFSFAEAGPAYVGGDTAALAWTFGPPDHPVARGLDIITVRDGLIAAVRTILAED